MKLLSWNVNGIRSVHRNGFLRWFKAQAADMVCLQETKAQPEQLGEELRHPLGYHSYWHSAERPGYSGVVTYSRRRPLAVREGIGRRDIDREGRVLVCEYRGFVLINAYFPNSQRDHSHLEYKLRFCNAMLRFANRLVKHQYIDCFRRFCQEPGHYTWWSYRPGVRERNVGWRIDYFFVNPELGRRLKQAYAQPRVMGSDHCPIGLELR